MQGMGGGVGNCMTQAAVPSLMLASSQAKVLLLLLLSLQVCALEACILRLVADAEVAASTAGCEAQQQAALKLQAAQNALAALEQVGRMRLCRRASQLLGAVPCAAMPRES